MILDKKPLNGVSLEVKVAISRKKNFEKKIFVKIFLEFFQNN